MNQERSTTRRISSTSSSEQKDHLSCGTASYSILLSLEIQTFNCTLDTLIPEGQVVVLVRLGLEHVLSQGFELQNPPVKSNLTNSIYWVYLNLRASEV